MHLLSTFFSQQQEGNLPPLTSTGLDQAAQSQTTTGLGPAAGGGDMFTGFLWIGLLLAFLWLVVIRPENKRQKEMKNIRENLKKGDRVVTSGGIHGQIARMDEETISIKVDEKVRLKIDRNAVARVEQATTEG